MLSPKLVWIRPERLGYCSGLRYEDLPFWELPGPDFQGRSVFIKPNLVMPPAAGEHHTTTHKSVVEALLKHLKASRVLIGDCGFKGQWSLTIERTGYGDLPAEVKCLARLPGRVVRFPTQADYLSLYGAEIAEEAYAADIWISAAKMKTHTLAGVTLTIKNLMGTFVRNKGAMHPRGDARLLHKRLRDLYFLLRSKVGWGLVDGIVGSSFSEQYGLPVNSGVLVFGQDLFEVDVLCCRLMGVLPDRIEYLRLIGEALGRPVGEECRGVPAAAAYEFFCGARNV